MAAATERGAAAPCWKEDRRRVGPEEIAKAMALGAER